MRLLKDSNTKSLYESLKELSESVMVTTGSTSITSDETGVVIEDNGNTITTGNGVSVSVDNENDLVPVGEELPEEDFGDELEDDSIEDIPEEDVENEAPTDELPEEDLEESSIKEEVLEKKDEETEEELNNSKADPVLKLSDTYTEIDVEPGHITAGPSIAREINSKKPDKIIHEADGYNQNQNVEIYKNPEFDYQILDITELDNTEPGDIRAIDMANILNDLDESLTEACGDPNYFRLNNFLTRKGAHKKTNESYSSAIVELSLPKLNESIGEYKNTFFLEVYGNNKLKECVVRDSYNHIIKEYSGKSSNPAEHFKNVFIDLDRARRLTEEVSDDAYEVADLINDEFTGAYKISWNEFSEALNKYIKELNLPIDDSNDWDFENDVRGCLSYLGWETKYESDDEANEGDLVKLTESAELYSTIYYLDEDTTVSGVAAFIRDLKQDFPNSNVQFKAIRSDGLPAVEIIGTFDNVKKFCYDFEPLNPTELGMSEYEFKCMITPYNGSLNETVEPMVSKPYNDKGINFADGRAIEKDIKRQENHLKQHKNRNKTNKTFKIEAEPDQTNTAGKKEEDLTDTEKVEKLPKVKKTKINAKQFKVKKLKESSEAGQAFWEKGFKVGDIITTSGAGDVEVLDINQGADYILVKRLNDEAYQPYVAAWAPDWYGDHMSWGQGHYFTDEESAREYFNSLTESVKLNEMDYSQLSDDELVDAYVKTNKDLDNLNNGDFNTNLLNFITSPNGGAAKIKAIQAEVDRRGIDWDEFIDKYLAKSRGSLKESNYADQLWQASSMFGGVGRRRLIDAASEASNAEEFKEKMLSCGQAGIFNNMSSDDLERLYNMAKETIKKESVNLKEANIGDTIYYLDNAVGYDDITIPESRIEEYKSFQPNMNFSMFQSSDDMWWVRMEGTLDELKELTVDNLGFFEPDEFDNLVAKNYIKRLDEAVKGKSSKKLTEAEDELLDEPDIAEGSDLRDGHEELEESGTEVAIFHRKPASVAAMRAAEQNGITVNKSNYRVVGTKELSNEEFEQFANHLSSEEYDWLKEYDDTSNSGEFKCVEVKNADDNSYSLLVDPQGYNYARYVAIKDNMDDEELLEPDTEEELISEEPVEEELINEE